MSKSNRESTLCRDLAIGKRMVRPTSLAYVGTFAPLALLAGSGTGCNLGSYCGTISQTSTDQPTLLGLHERSVSYGTRTCNVDTRFLLGIPWTNPGSLYTVWSHLVYLSHRQAHQGHRAQKPAAMDSCFGVVRPHQHGTAGR